MTKARVNVTLSTALFEQLRAYRGSTFSRKVEELLWFALTKCDQAALQETTEHPASEATSAVAMSEFADDLKALQERVQALEVWHTESVAIVDDIDGRLERIEDQSLDSRLQEIEAVVEQQ